MKSHYKCQSMVYATYEIIAETDKSVSALVPCSKTFRCPRLTLTLDACYFCRVTRERQTNQTHGPTDTHQTDALRSSLKKSKIIFWKLNVKFYNDGRCENSLSEPHESLFIRYCIPKAPKVSPP